MKKMSDIKPIRKNKKGVSEIIAYALLLVFAVSMSGLVYSWLRKSIPKIEEKCPDGVSIEIASYFKESEGKVAHINITNRGLFAINGFSFRLKDASGKICAISGIGCVENSNECTKQGEKLIFLYPLNSSKTREISISSTCSIGEVEIVPMKLIEKDTKKEWSICENSIIKEKLN
ncbi:MAG: hypothetical protein QXF25_01155 [Candidatus Pacearchaeota archaeon]